MNGEVVSESESDDPEDYLKLSSAPCESLKDLVKKKRKAVKDRSLSSLSHSVSSKILQDCPDIGNTIESCVEDHGVGADAWRRTGVLT